MRMRCKLYKDEARKLTDLYKKKKVNELTNEEIDRMLDETFKELTEGNDELINELFGSKKELTEDEKKEDEFWMNYDCGIMSEELTDDFWEEINRTKDQDNSRPIKFD